MFVQAECHRCQYILLLKEKCKRLIERTNAIIGISLTTFTGNDDYPVSQELHFDYLTFGNTIIGGVEAFKISILQRKRAQNKCSHRFPLFHPFTAEKHSFTLPANSPS